VPLWRIVVPRPSGAKKSGIRTLSECKRLKVVMVFSKLVDESRTGSSSLKDELKLLK